MTVINNHAEGRIIVRLRLYATLQLMLAVSITLACTRQPSNLPQSQSTLEEENNIYSVVLRQRFAGQGDRLVVIKDRTIDLADEGAAVSESWILKRDKPAAAMSEHLIADFIARNTEHKYLRQTLRIPIRHLFVGDNETEPLPGDESTDMGKLYDRIKDRTGLIGFSRAGFDSDGKKALLYVSYRCGSKCDSGTYYLMKRSGMTWEIEKEIIGWIS